MQPSTAPKAKAPQSAELSAATGKWGPPGVVRELNRLADLYGSRAGLGRRAFLKSQMGLAASFLALTTVFGPYFRVDPAEASQPEAAREGIARHANQFIFDVQVHYVQEGYPSPEGLLSLRRAAGRKWVSNMSAGERTRSGSGRPSGRSKPCAASKFRRPCARLTDLSPSARPTERSRTGSSD